jgi:hypothetical protein
MPCRLRFGAFVILMNVILCHCVLFLARHGEISRGVFVWPSNQKECRVECRNFVDISIEQISGQMVGINVRCSLIQSSLG